MATASQLLYECPYARSAGRFAPALQLDITAALGVLNHRVSSHAAPKIARPTPFVPPPPAAVTTHSFGELLKSRTRPGRYGPAEVSSSTAAPLAPQLPAPALPRAELTRTPFLVTLLGHATDLRQARH